ncbi:MAG: helix-turn-helix domain-containing protein [Alphaproteobacteria bacterium]|nr:helix-turn-helix domain-containing protein [Alphaproteobacteria bacterium]
MHFDIDSLSHSPAQKDVVQAQSLGQTLRTKREKKKLSLEDVASKLCIKEAYLKALEEGHYYAFPSRVYGIGFLRTYAKFLELDSDLMVAEFHAETSDIKDAPLDMPVIEKHFAMPSKKTLIIVALIIALLIAIWFAVAAFLSTDVFSKISLPYETTAQETEVVSDEIAPAVADESLAPKTEEKKEEAKADKKVNQAVFSAKAAIVVSGDVWVRLHNTQTGKTILDKTMAQNDSFIPEADLKVLQISTGRAGLVDLYRDGKKVHTFAQEKGRSLAEFAN